MEITAVKLEEGLGQARWVPQKVSNRAETGGRGAKR